MTTYRFPFDLEEYPREPTDEDAIVLARALAHYAAAYPDVRRGVDDTPTRTIQSVVLDVLDANGLSDPAMSRDEVVRIAAVLGLEV